MTLDYRAGLFAAALLADYLAALALELQAHDRRDHGPGDEDRS